MSVRQRVSRWLTPAAVLVGLLALALVGDASAGPRGHRNRRQPQRVERIDKELKARSGRLGGTSHVIIQIKPGQDGNASQEVRKLGGRVGRKLKLIDGMVVELPNRVIKALSERSEVISIHYDRPTGQHLNRAAVTVGARAVRQQYGYDGAGVGVAVIDSGITSQHDDMSYHGTSSLVRVVNGQRTSAFVDFVNGLTTAYDDNGHGTHVSGIIAGNGYDSHGARAGIAPAAHIVSLKVLDHDGPRRHQRRHRCLRVGGSEPRRAQHPRHQPLGRREGDRVVPDRPADAGRQARGRRRHRGCHGRRQPWQEGERQGAVPAASPPPATRRGC